MRESNAMIDKIDRLMKSVELIIVIAASFAFAIGFIALMACIVFGIEGKHMEYAFFSFLFGGVLWARGVS
jgi:hypothetical protein